jgi:hypothetical protein
VVPIPRPANLLTTNSNIPAFQFPQLERWQRLPVLGSKGHPQQQSGQPDFHEHQLDGQAAQRAEQGQAFRDVHRPGIWHPGHD